MITWAEDNSVLCAVNWVDGRSMESLTIRRREEHWIHNVAAAKPVIRSAESPLTAIYRLEEKGGGHMACRRATMAHV